MLSKLTQFVKQSQYHIFLAICIGLISFISFNLGKINSGEKKNLTITQDMPAQAGANIYKAVAAGDLPVDKAGGDYSNTPSTTPIPSTAPKTTPKPLDMRVVVSKASDSKKYHYSWCGTWKRIKVENQVWFNSDKEAEAQGYTLAGNCTK